MEEDRRLLYVALTRARDTLTITRLNLSNSPVNFTSNRNPDLDLYFFADLPDQLAKRINNVELSRPAPPSGIELPRIDLSVEL
ncbi:3'-5' exonuclease [Flaviflexus ciconiae]|uniref:3'-5' exonuclease n=1 Tax=Flaviflexus ciconiae TaxID=2496867 RepID=UPI003898EA39